MKIRKLLGLSILSLLVSTTACTTDSTVSNTTALSTDAQIKSFTLAANTKVLTNLDKVFFTIDQQNNEIYNGDSLPVGTKFTKLLTNITFASASKATIEYNTNKTASYTTTDSIDYTAPFKIKVTAYDGVTEKTYTVKLNVHNVKPDTLEWRKQSFDGWNETAFAMNKTVAFKSEFLTYLKSSIGIQLFGSLSSNGVNWAVKSHNLPTTAQIETITKFGNNLYVRTIDYELYSSADGLSWTKVNSSYSFVALNGAIFDQDALEHLITTIDDNGTLRLASTTDGTTFSLCDGTALPENFPISGFASNIKTIGLTEKLTLIGGKNKAGNLLNSVQQMYWDKSGFHIGYDLENGGSYFSKREGAFSYNYDNKMYVSCGRSSGVVLRDVYVSKDNGVTWAIDSKNVLPAETIFNKRSYSSAIVDSNRFIWIFGGLNSSNANINEIWKGRINKYGFIRQ